MSDSVSVIIPALDDVELLARNLPAIGDEFAARDGLDELVVVDDTGGGVLTGWVAERFPHATLVTRQENGGYGKALLDGVRAAQNELVFATNPDVRVRPGFLAPLVAAMEDPEVFAASPRVLLGGRDDEIESHNALAVEDGRLRVLARSTAGVDRHGRPRRYPGA